MKKDMLSTVVRNGMFITIGAIILDKVGEHFKSKSDQASIDINKALAEREKLENMGLYKPDYDLEIRENERVIKDMIMNLLEVYVGDQQIHPTLYSLTEQAVEVISDYAENKDFRIIWNQDCLDGDRYIFGPDIKAYTIIHHKRTVYQNMYEHDIETSEVDFKRTYIFTVRVNKKGEYRYSLDQTIDEF